MAQYTSLCSSSEAHQVTQRVNVSLTHRWSVCTLTGALLRWCTVITRNTYAIKKIMFQNWIISKIAYFLLDTDHHHHQWQLPVVIEPPCVHAVVAELCALCRYMVCHGWHVLPCYCLNGGNKIFNFKFSKFQLDTLMEREIISDRRVQMTSTLLKVNHQHIMIRVLDISVAAEPCWPCDPWATSVRPAPLC